MNPEPQEIGEDYEDPLYDLAVFTYNIFTKTKDIVQ